jgi:hypothetical protein
LEQAALVRLLIEVRLVLILYFHQQLQQAAAAVVHQVLMARV